MCRRAAVSPRYERLGRAEPTDMPATLRELLDERRVDGTAGSAHAKKARVHDRTYYTGRVKKNFVPHHAQRVSLAIVKGEGDIVAAVANRRKNGFNPLTGFTLLGLCGAAG